LSDNATERISDNKVMQIRSPRMHVKTTLRSPKMINKDLPSDDETDYRADKKAEKESEDD